MTSHHKKHEKILIKDIEVYDVRFPTHLDNAGSDAVHTDPDYSACYIIIKVCKGVVGKMWSVGGTHKGVY